MGRSVLLACFRFFAITNEPPDVEYLRYWSLRERPFGPAAARFFYTASPQRQAMAWIQQQVTKGQRLSLLVSRSGLGATTLLRQVSTHAGFDDCAVEAVYTSGRENSVDRVYRSVASAMGMARQWDSTGRSIDAIKSAVDSARAQRLQCVWLIDEIGKHSLDAVLQLAQQGLRISVVASVSPSLLRLLSKKVGDRVPRMKLDVLSANETAQFITHSLQVAGCQRELFSHCAVESIYNASGGRLRKIGQIADQSLMLAAKERLGQVTKREVALMSGEYSSRAA